MMNLMSAFFLYKKFLTIEIFVSYFSFTELQIQNLKIK